MLIPRSVFSISSICGDDATKFALDTVKLERDANGNPLAIASDGSRVIIAKWKDKIPTQDFRDATNGDAHTEPNPGFSVLVPVKPWDEICKAIPKKTEHPVLENALVPESDVGKTVPLETWEDDGTVRRISAKAPNGNFPDWRTALPEYNILPLQETSNDAVRIRVSAEAMQELLKTVYTTAGKTSDFIDLIVPYNSRMPVELRSNSEEGVKVTGFLYPIQSPEVNVAFEGALPAPKPVEVTSESK